MSPIVESGHTDIGPPAPPPEKSALGFFFVLMILYVGLGATAQALHPVAGLLWTEFFVFLLPPAIAAAGSNLLPAPFLRLSRRPSARQMWLGAASGLALFLAAGGIMSLTSQLLPRSWVELFDVTRLFEGSKRHQLGMALVASVLAPFAEEVAFRGYVLSALRTRLPAGAAIVGSAVLFASMHLDPVRFPAVLFLGLFLGWFAWRSGSIWPAVVAHGVNNGLGSAIAVASETDAGEGSLAASLVILALGLAALAPLAVAWVRATPEPPASSSEILRRDANDPSTRFRFAGVPAGWRALAALGVLLYLALGVLRYLQDGRR